jgi:hypothetical protein
LFSRLHDKRHPASYNYGRVDDVIWDTYLHGRKAFSIDENVQTEQSKMYTGHATDDNAVSRMAIKELVGKVVSNVMVFLSADEYTARYLQEKGCKLGEDVERLTNKVLTCDIQSDNIHFKSITGVSEVVNTEGLTRLEIEQALHKLIIRFISNAAITPATHSIVGSVVDLNDLARNVWDSETERTVCDVVNSNMLTGDVSCSKETYQRDGSEESSILHGFQGRTDCEGRASNDERTFSRPNVNYIVVGKNNSYQLADDS